MLETGRRRILQTGGIAAAVLLSSRRSRAQAKPLKIGVLTDLSGPYSEPTGVGCVVAARLAIEDFRKQHPDIAVELVSADMQLKPDVGSNIARSWFDQEGVDLIVDVPQSAVALAVATVAQQRDKLAVFTSPGLADLSGKACSANHIQWTFDLWATGSAMVRALVPKGADSWFFIVPDYVAGRGMADDASAVLKSMGGRELGRTTYAFPGTTDFSSQLLEAKTSGAKVICLANAGNDTANCLKQANEFGIPQSGVILGCITLQDYVIKSVGLEASQGLIAAIPWVWNMNTAARAFADRFSPLVHGNKPDFFHAGAYSGVTHYLKAVALLGVDQAKASGRAVAERMKAMPVDDPLYQGTVRADGKFVHDMYVWATKTPAESKEPWDYFRLVNTVPAAQAYQSVADAGCPLVKS